MHPPSLIPTFIHYPPSPIPILILPSSLPSFPHPYPHPSILSSLLSSSLPTSLHPLFPHLILLTVLGIVRCSYRFFIAGFDLWCVSKARHLNVCLYDPIVNVNENIGSYMKTEFGYVSWLHLLWWCCAATVFLTEVCASFLSPAVVLVSALGSLVLLLALAVYRHKHPVNLYLLLVFVSLFFLVSSILNTELFYLTSFVFEKGPLVQTWC